MRKEGEELKEHDMEIKRTNTGAPFSSLIRRGGDRRREQKADMVLKEVVL